MSTAAHPPTATSTVSVERTPVRPVNKTAIVIATVVGVTVVVLALSLPDVTGNAGTMTHYMGLLVANQPWNLLIFMAIPVILAETLAVSELAVLFRQGDVSRWVHQLNRWAGLLAGPWFLGITVYLTKNAVVPLTSGGAWHGAADLIAVGAYLAGVIPLVGITLIEFGILGRGPARARMRLHAIFVGIFLVAAHIAMIFGMLDPSLFGWTPADTTPTGDIVPGMGM